MKEKKWYIEQKKEKKGTTLQSVLYYKCLARTFKTKLVTKLEFYTISTLSI